MVCINNSEKALTSASWKQYLSGEFSTFFLTMSATRQSTFTGSWAPSAKNSLKKTQSNFFSQRVSSQYTTADYFEFNPLNAIVFSQHKNLVHIYTCGIERVKVLLNRNIFPCFLKPARVQE